MSPLHSLVTTVAASVAAATVVVGMAPSATAAPHVTNRPPAYAATTRSSAPSGLATVAVPASTSAPCTSVRQIGDRRVVPDLGMSAFTVRQYIGWCRDARGSAWMNFASVYVWNQYHARGFAYRSLAGVAVRGEPETRGFTTSANRQQLSYSIPVRTTSVCTQGWGKLYRSGSESAQGFTSLVC